MVYILSIGIVFHIYTALVYLLISKWQSFKIVELNTSTKCLHAASSNPKLCFLGKLWFRHYHSMEVFANFDIFNGTEKVAEGHKASFCLEDNLCLRGATPKFSCAHYGDQGISVNCSDIYKHNIDCQWVDITDISTGYYVFKVSINPEFQVPEMRFDNNLAVCQMLYTETTVRLFDCQVAP